MLPWPSRLARAPLCTCMRGVRLATAVRQPASHTACSTAQVESTLLCAAMLRGVSCAHDQLRTNCASSDTGSGFPDEQVAAACKQAGSAHLAAWVVLEGPAQRHATLQQHSLQRCCTLRTLAEAQHHIALISSRIAALHATRR